MLLMLMNRPFLFLINKIPIDIFAGFFELVGLWIVGNKSMFGFLFNVVGNMLWIYVGCKKKVYGLLVICIPALFINIRNFFLWM
jgi:nicotinamide riboside transporter PnuC